MKKTILSIFALCALSISSNAQSFEWVKQIEGNGVDQIFSVSSNGSDIYSTGTYDGTTDFNPGIVTDIQPAVGGLDVFIQKLDENGEFVWAKTIGGMDNDMGRVINDYGTHVIVSGTFSGTVDFDPGTGVESKTSNGGTDVFILALDDNGDFLWVNTFGGTANESIGGQELNSSNKIIATGGFYNNMTINATGGPVTVSATSTGGTDVFFMELDLITGSVEWVKSFGGTGIDSGAKLAIRSNDNILITGRYQNIMDIDPSANDFSLSSDGGFSVFLTEYDNLGNFINGFSFDSSSDMEAYDVALDDNENIYLTGYFKATVDFDLKAGVTDVTTNGGQDCYVVKLTSTKDLVWAKNFGGAGLDQSFGLELASNGDVYTTGRYSDVVDFDPGAGVVNGTASGFDIFIHKFNELGNFQMVHTFSDVGSDMGRGLEIDANGNMYVGGMFAGTIDFDPSTGTSNLTTDGTSDVFVIKYSNLVLGLNSLAQKLVFNVYPNPAQNELFMEIDDLTTTKIEIFDYSGQLVKSIVNNTINQIDISDLKEGVYILSVHAQKGISNARFIKQ